MIKTDKLKFSYDGTKMVLNLIDLDLEGGKIYGLLGQNGSGKTSLMHLLMGYNFPTSGKIEILGYEPKERHPHFLSKIMIADMIFPQNLNCLQLAKRYGCYYPNFSEEDLLRNLNEFQIESKSKLQSLSLGDKKKALFSLCFALNTCILLLDEPSDGLDIPSKSIFRKMLTRWVNEDRICIIATHQIRELEVTLDHILFLHEKRIMISTDVIQLTEKLRFRVAPQVDEDDSQVIYKSRSPYGYKIIQKANQEYESLEPDIELLYNAFLTNPSYFEVLFSHKVLA